MPGFYGPKVPLGLVGAVAATRYVGGTTTAAPVTGTFKVGDFAIAQDGEVWICTVAGTPGTWVGSTAGSVVYTGITGVPTNSVLGRATAGVGAAEALTPGGGLTISAASIVSSTIVNDTAWAAKGDLIVATANDTAAIVGIGAAGTVLESVGGTAAWSSKISSGTLAARPAAAAGNTNWLYLATDIGGGMAFLSTGAAWVPLSQSAAIEMAAMITFTGNGQAGGTDVTLWAPGTIPAASMAVGTTYIINVTCDFDILNSVTARNLVFKLKLGATTIWSATYIVTVSTAITNQPLLLPIQFMAAVAGVGGTIRSQTNPVGAYAVGVSNTAKLMTGGTTGTSAVAVDLSASQAITLTVNESVNSVADVVRAQTGSLIVAGT